MMLRTKRSRDPEAPDPDDVTQMDDKEFEEYYDKNWRQYDQEAEPDDEQR